MNLNDRIGAFLPVPAKEPSGRELPPGISL
jgi:hypothetical protein